MEQQEGYFIPGATYAHNPQTLIPHTPTPPREDTPSLIQVHWLVHLPYLGLQQQTISEFSEICSSYGTPSRRTHFLNTLSHLERFSHRADNLPLQPQPPLSPRESVAHKFNNLLLQLFSSIRRTTTRNKQ